MESNKRVEQAPKADPKTKAVHDKTESDRLARDKLLEKRAVEDRKRAEERAAEDVELDPVKRELENKRIDQERMAAGNPTKITTPDGQEKIVTDGATNDGYGNEIKR